MVNHLCVLGLGRLGLPLAVSFARTGLQVTGYDLDPKKVRDVNAKRPPIQEPELEVAIQKTGAFLKATIDPHEAVGWTEACIFVAPTPSLPDGSFDNRHLLDGIAAIAHAVREQNRKSPYLFIIASTVTPGSCEKVLLPAIQQYSANIQLVYKPELIALGTVMRDLVHPDIGLIGANDKAAADEVFRLYSRLQLCDFQSMSLVEAELAKISLNCAVTMKISFANQVGMIAKQLGADPHVILNFLGHDSRIGHKALRPGLPFGGNCFPRDNRMFQYVAKKAGIIAHLAAATDAINETMLKFILAQVPADGDVGILGLAYKAGTAITEESAGMALMTELRNMGRTVKVHDPLIMAEHLEEVLASRTIVVTIDSAEYRGLRVKPGQFLIDPMRIIETKKEPLARGASK